MTSQLRIYLLILTSLCLWLSVLWALGWKICLLQTITHGCLSYFADSIQKTNSVSHINKVHVVFSNHLDIGFHSNITGVPGTDRAVISRYFQHHFPAAIATANSLRSKDYDTFKLLSLNDYKDIRDSNEARSLNSTRRYRYLTHAWLVSLYLECPAWLGESCPSEKERGIFREAIYRGDITWHALPHNCEVEFFLDPAFLRWSVEGFVHELDRCFGLNPKRTISQRDVPGLTRASIPILTKAGVRAISVGVNSGSAPPAVPLNKLFWWRDHATNSKLLAFWHPGGYSGVPVDDSTQCIMTSGLEHALCCAWKGDNEGPHTPREVSLVFDTLYKQFPHVSRGNIFASDFDAFVDHVFEKFEAGKLELPTVEHEIGDSWIHGIATDPVKVSEYRSLLRSWSNAIRDDKHDTKFPKEFHDESALFNFARILAKVPEHTWGVDTKQYPGDYLRWNNSNFHQVLNSKETKFMAAVDSWKKQRDYIELALRAVSGTEFGRQATRSLQLLRQNRRPPITEINGRQYQNMNPININDKYFSVSPWRFSLSSKTGALSSLIWTASRTPKVLGPSSCNSANHEIEWIGEGGALGELLYSTYDESSFRVIWSEYAYRPSPLPDWFYKDFGKPNATKLGGAKLRSLKPTLKRVFHLPNNSSNSLHVIAEVAFDSEAIVNAGAPAVVYIEYRVLENSKDLLIDVTWVNKTSTRLPEAMWVTWRPGSSIVDDSSWKLSKLGQQIYPLESIKNGSMALHAVDDNGVSVSSKSRCRQGETYQLKITSLDAALTCIGKPNPLPNINVSPDLSFGMSTCLVNNIWGTNYPMWYPYDGPGRTMKFRFRLQAIQSPNTT